MGKTFLYIRTKIGESDYEIMLWLFPVGFSKPPLKYVLHKAYALKHKLQKT